MIGPLTFPLGEVGAASPAQPEPQPIAPRDRPILAQAPVVVNGVWGHEVAMADPLTGTVTVIAGGRVVFQQSGLGRPTDIKLADLNDDGISDLIVADAANNRVLVYPGLASGGFGSERNAGFGLATGVDPVDLTVGDINRDDRPDLLVTNKGSNNISVFLGSGTPAAWTLNPASSLPAGDAPFRAVLATPPGQTDPVLLICNSGSHNVLMYDSGPAGPIGTQPPQILDVGTAPSDMVVGPFTHRSQLDLMTLNGDSHDLTFISNILGPRPTRLAITATAPALATSLLSILGPNSTTTGLADLIVGANDGRLSVLQVGPGGLQLTELAVPTALGVVTAIAAGESLDGSTLEVFEAIGSGDLIAEYQLDLASLAWSGATAEAAPLSDDTLSWELVPTGGGSAMSLIGVLWSSPTSQPSASTDSVRDRTDPAGTPVPGPGTPPSALTPGTDTEVRPSGDESEAAPSAEAPADGWARYVLGLDAALDSLQGEVAALAPADQVPGGSDPIDDLPLDPTSRRLVARAGSLLADPSGDLSPSAETPAPASPPGATSSDRDSKINPKADSGAERPPELVTAAVGSVVAVRLLVNASPPRPPRIRTTRRHGTVAPWPEVLPPTDPHA